MQRLIRKFSILFSKVATTNLFPKDIGYIIIQFKVQIESALYDRGP
jgi:hypothetical protein